jgi:hypothetical protein
MDLHIGEMIRVWKPRPLQKQEIRYWHLKFFQQLEPSWNNFRPKPLEINMVRGWLKKFNPNMLPTIFAECEKSNNFSKTFWWKWKQLPTVKKEKKPKQKTLI